MARIPAPSNRSTKNVRNGPSALQLRLTNLLREARWLGFLALAAWLGLVLATWTSTDPAWSHSIDTQHIKNKGGALGAYTADLLYFLFGLSAWLWVVLLLQRVALGFYRLSHAVAPTKVSAPQRLPRIQWEAGIGFVLLLIGSMLFEYQLITALNGILPAGAGGQLGRVFAELFDHTIGPAGTTLLFLAFIAAGSSLWFNFSWLWVIEKIGFVVEGLIKKAHLKFAERADRKVGLAKKAERRESVAQKQEKLVHDKPVRIEPSVAPTPKAAPAAPKAATSAPFAAANPTPATATVSTSSTTVLPPAKPPVRAQQSSHENSELPSVSLLDAADANPETISNDTLEFTSRLIEKRLADFGVTVTVESAQSGPVITRYEIEPAVGVKGSQIVNLSKDLARSLSLLSIRVVETIPGKNLMGLELPNPKRQVVRLEEIIASEVYVNSKSLLTVALGKDIAGYPVVADLARMPHLLVAGTTGSGKSVGINAMILSLLYKATPDEVKLILIDPKMLEMSVYEGIPHLLAPVVTDMRQAANALNWCVNEMEKRYRLMSKLGVRNVAGFNAKVLDAQKSGQPLSNPFSLTPDAPEPLDTLPYIVVVIDELADLMMVAGKKIEELIARLAQKARAAGIHLVLATQRPSVDVITGLIKANIPTRISFQVSSRVDSRTILDQMGAETLLGQGDMLYLPPGTAMPKRVHGAFVHDDEVHRVVEYLKEHNPEPDYIDGILEGVAPGETGDGLNPVTGFADAEADPLYDQAVAVVLQQKRASISLVQRHLRIGYNRSARLLEQMEQSGVVSPMQPNGSREILAPTGGADEEA